MLVAAPPTTNWDLLYLLAAAWALRVKLSWMGKHTLFVGPLGPLMRLLGGIPVRRDARSDLVDQMRRAFAERPDLVLTIPPEGTRALTPHWKSGFYHIARGARVPIVLSSLDYARRTARLGPTFLPSTDCRRDMDVIRAFYAGVMARHPERFGTIRLADEG